MEEISYIEKPDLHQPYLIIGFEGWPNAAEVSSYALEYLVEKLEAKKFASMPIESFSQLSSSRPEGTIKEGRLVELKYPSHHFYYSKQPLSNDLILFSGVEPHLQWTRYADLLLGLAERFNVDQIVTVGGTYDFIPHTYPPLVSALFNREDLREKVVQAGLGLTEYKGPISIHTFILEAARKRGLKALSLWGHAPQYLQARNIKVIYSVLKSLANLTKMEIDLSEMKRASDHFDVQVNHLLEQDPKIQEVISKLEEDCRRSGKIPPLSEGEGGPKEEKVVYIQAFLKKQEDGDKKEG
jgi:proteasome assembly chaperone (PAC2) family protein